MSRPTDFPRGFRPIPAQGHAVPFGAAGDDDDGPHFFPMPVRRRRRPAAAEAPAPQPQRPLQPPVQQPMRPQVHPQVPPQVHPQVHPQSQASVKWQHPSPMPQQPRPQAQTWARPEAMPRAQAAASTPMPMPAMPMPPLPAFMVPPGQMQAARRWWRPGFPWLGPRSWLLLATLALLAGLGAWLLGWMAPADGPAPQRLPMAQQQLRHFLHQVEECRGTESLLVMLPIGAERDAALTRLQAQQKEIDFWVRDNSPWLAAAHGADAVAHLREASAAWRSLQQRIALAEVVVERNGQVRESRRLLAGPSAQAYRRIVLLVEGLSKRQPG